MIYIEVCLKLDVSLNHKLDAIIASLSDIGFEGFVEEEDKLIAYVQESIFDNADMYELPIIKNNKENISISLKKIPETNWNSLWESNFEQVHIKNCVVRAPFHNKPAGVDYDIVIEPKMSFGTGHHETTSMIIEAILDKDFENKTVLDMGCGTAVLAILADMKKARIIDAVDNDEWAYNNALENCKRNNAKHCSVKLGGIEAVAEESYDIIIANITRNILVDMMPFFSKMQNINAHLYLSGFLKDDVGFMTEKAKEFDYKLIKEFYKNNWAALELYKEY